MGALRECVCARTNSQERAAGLICRTGRGVGVHLNKQQQQQQQQHACFSFGFVSYFSVIRRSGQFLLRQFQAFVHVSLNSQTSSGEYTSHRDQHLNHFHVFKKLKEGRGCYSSWHTAVDTTRDLLVSTVYKR